MVNEYDLEDKLEDAIRQYAEAHEVALTYEQIETFVDIAVERIEELMMAGYELEDAYMEYQEEILEDMKKIIGVKKR